MKKFQIFDSHLHIINPLFPLVENQGYLPPSYLCEDYLAQTAPYQLLGGAVVSGSFQAFDQSYLIAALNELGTGFVGVTQLPASVSDQEILKLHAEGVRAVRFNLKRGGSEKVAELAAMASRVFELAGWHVELYADTSTLGDLADTIKHLPKASIDHLGLSSAGLPLLLSLAESGVGVKATGFSRIDFDVGTALKDLYSANPNCLMFGTDLPSTRAPRPYHHDDYELVVSTLGEEQSQRVFSQNALSFYGID